MLARWNWSQGTVEAQGALAKWARRHFFGFQRLLKKGKQELRFVTEPPREKHLRDCEKKWERYREHEHSVTVLKFHESAQKPHAYKVERDIGKTQCV